MSKDDSGIQFLQKGGFRANKHRGRPADVLVMPDGALLGFRRFGGERFIESAIESSSKRFYPFGLDQGYSFKVAVYSASAG